MSGGESAAYVYALTRPFPAGAVRELRGVGEHPVRLVAEDDLVAVTSAVPLREYDEDALKAKLEDLDWLEAVARAHNRVVDEVARHAVTLPLRLATVYRGDDRVREMLRDGRHRFGAALSRLAGRVEWGVKVYADPAASSSAPGPSGTPQTEARESPGKAYLRRRREQRQRRDDTWEQATGLVREVDEALRGLAEAREQHRPQHVRLTGERGENVLNAAYLVPAERSQPFLDAVARLRERAPGGTRIEVSGPWVPYSFASVADEPAAETAGGAAGGPADAGRRAGAGGGPSEGAP
ncbi:GvpL/GvpF family gas vesicle protein [Marinitenerispora sediminis]|uniref:Gas vesicle protein GvpFL n=1 Tax=Marinitenerispora sediminis TaxID=1931232 RepID=A0A368T2G9_9ACTN|nr:GvpL/GvpF family gas vesicle protein [Marinitenerispora sediminis]RCV47942.1 gas vesicle protein GvpFL [Marinitenerispora sediminis]RCV51892.1 gas vesicle protein GvpFL [Marinitenerispora sediminis]RCV55655.1 gas vesicle protein GvpFL [Marinitenerispora sediminis]